VRAPCVLRLQCRVAQPGVADPIAAMGWLLRVPDPSRRASASGSGTGLPLGAAAMAGAGPTQASSRESSPLRKRWQRTPPVARPLDGYCRNSVTFTEPASVPGSARELPATVATTASVADTAPK